MAEVVVLLNPLDVSRRRRARLDDDVPLLAWVDAHEPALGGIARQVFVNGVICTDADYRTHPGDEVLVAFAPGDPATVGSYILHAIVSMAIGFVLAKIFAPKNPTAADTPAPSQVYGIAPPKNAARLGQPIPVIYGSVVALPDFAAQPYVRFTADNKQILYALLCLGQGEHDVTELLLGQTASAALPPDVVRWTVFQPAQHASTFGIIQGTIDGFLENMVTSPAVGDQELIAPNMGGVLIPTTWYWALSNTGRTASFPGGLDLRYASSPAAKLAALPQNPAIGTAVFCTLGYDGSTYTFGTYTATAITVIQVIPPGALVPPPAYSGAGADKWVGPFETCKAWQVGALVELDFVFPGGLFVADGSGNLGNRTVDVQVGVQQLDAAGSRMGAEVFYTETFTAKDNTAQRFTRPHPVASGRYRVRVKRTTDSDGKATTSDRVVWTGLKFQLDPPPAGTRVYGNVTLIAVRLTATNGVASDAAGSMRFRCTRRLAPLASPTDPTAPTVNPADAFADILCAPYGGARPPTADELDLVELGIWRPKWAAHNGFNAVFDQAGTVWEALSLSVQTVHAAPLPVGSRMSLIHDAKQPVRAQLFTDENVVAGSLKVTCAFDQDGTPAGVRVNYRDAATFSPAAYVSPADAPDYVSLDLFGCTAWSVARAHGIIASNKRRLQRKNLTFETELEGLNVLPGDRIGVASGTVKWSQSARVERVDGLALTLSKALTWTSGQTHAVTLRDPQGAPVRLLGVVRGAADNVLVLPADPGFPITPANAGQEATTLAFGVATAGEPSDWVVAKVTPNGETVTIEALNYDPTVYDVPPASDAEILEGWPGAARDAGALVAEEASP